MRNRIRVLRAERQWSQAELAARVGVSRQTVNAVENDKYDPALSLAFKISRMFDVPVEEVFQFDEAADRPPADSSQPGGSRLSISAMGGS